MKSGQGKESTNKRKLIEILVESSSERRRSSEKLICSFQDRGSKSISKVTWKWSQREQLFRLTLSHTRGKLVSYDFEPCREPSVTMLQAVVHTTERWRQQNAAPREPAEYITVLVFTPCYKYLPVQSYLCRLFEYKTSWIPICLS